MKPGLEDIQLWFENLFEGKVIYREKFIAVVRLENVEIISSTYLCATAIPLLDITAPESFAALVRERGKQMPTEPWSFRGGEWVRTEGKSICCPYGGWTIWAEPDLVRAVELLACAGLKEQAVKLLYASEMSREEN